MNRTGRAALMLTIGAVMARLLWSGGFGWFVQQRMRWPLILATVVLIVFGLYEVFAGERQEREDEDSAKRAVAPGVGWHMILPLMVLIAVAPTGLGAAAADRVEAFTPTQTSARTFEPVDSSGGPVEMRVFDFLDRAAWDDQRSLEGETIRLEGLVVNDLDIDDGFKLTRFMVSCCAADGIPLQVIVRGVDQSFDDDTWVVADVVWREPDVPYQDTPTPWDIEADVVSITVVTDPPSDAYESPY